MYKTQLKNIKNMQKFYEFSVALDDKYARVVARDKLSASKKGAQALGVAWKERARDLVVIQGREIRRTELEKLGLAVETQTKKPRDKNKNTTKRRAASAPAGRK